MNIADTIANAHQRGAHRPFKDAKMTHAQTKRTDPASLVICNDPLPSHRASPGNKYEPTIRAMQVGQAIKCWPNEVGRVSGAMRKYIEANGVKAKVASTKRYEADGLGRVWMVALEAEAESPPAPVGKALKSVRG